MTYQQELQRFIAEYNRREGLCEMLVRLAFEEYHTPDQLNALHKSYNALQVKNSAAKKIIVARAVDDRNFENFSKRIEVSVA